MVNFTGRRTFLRVKCDSSGPKRVEEKKGKKERKKERKKGKKYWGICDCTVFRKIVSPKTANGNRLLTFVRDIAAITQKTICKKKKKTSHLIPQWPQIAFEPLPKNQNAKARDCI